MDETIIEGWITRSNFQIKMLKVCKFSFWNWNFYNSESPNGTFWKFAKLAVWHFTILELHAKHIENLTLWNSKTRNWEIEKMIDEWLMDHGSWLEAHGSCLEARGSRLMAPGSWARQNWCVGLWPGGPGAKLFLAMSLEPRAWRHEPWAMSHEPFICDQAMNDSIFHFRY